MWRMFLAALAACSFTHGAPTAPSDGAGDAAPLAPDAPADASYTACTATGVGSAMAAGTLGGTGGGTPNFPTSCNPGEFAVGMGFDYSPDDVGGQETAIIDVNVRCGTLARDRSGAITTTYMEIQTTPTGGFCIGGSVDSIAEQDCPDGAVIVGMTANEAGGSLYNTVAVQCAAVNADFTIAAATTTLSYATGSYSDRPQVAMCPPNTAFDTFSIRDGCANDLLGPKCVALACP